MNEYVLCLCCGRPVIKIGESRLYCDKCGKKKQEELVNDWNNLSEEEKNKLLGIH